MKKNWKKANKRIKEKIKLVYLNFLPAKTKRDTRRFLTILLISMK